MNENESSRRASFLLNFPQMVFLLALQAVLVGGSFYLGTRFARGPVVYGTLPVQDQQIANLLPNPAVEPTVLPANPPLQERTRQEGEEDSAPRVSPGVQNHPAAKGTVFRFKSSNNSEYTLQIASYPEEDLALQAVNDWKQKGYMAFIAVQDLPDSGKWYRVNVGNFGDEKAAQDFAKSFEEKEKIIPQVVVNE